MLQHDIIYYNIRYYNVITYVEHVNWCYRGRTPPLHRSGVGGYLATWAYFPAHLPTCLPTFLPSFLPSYLPFYLPFYLPTLPSCLPSYLQQGSQQMGVSDSRFADSRLADRSWPDRPTVAALHSSKGNWGGPKEWGSSVITGLIVVYSHFFACLIPRVDRRWKHLATPISFP